MPQEHDVNAEPQEPERDENQGRRGIMLVSKYDGHEYEEGVEVIEEEAQ